MLAWMSHKPGGPETLTLEERPEPNACDDELLVRVLAVGVNYPDGLFIRDLYQVKPQRPFSPGGEFCGVVEKVGANVSTFRVGDVVVGRCGWGALSQRISISHDRCLRIPSQFPPIDAAAFLFTYATAYHALHDIAKLQTGEHVLVLGAAGGVGSAAIELACAAGATVYAAVSTDEKLAFARSCGAHDGVVYDANLQPGADQKKLGRLLQSITSNGVDVVFDPVGGNYTEPALRSLKRGGRHLVVGFTAGIPAPPLNLVLLKSTRILGVDWRTFAREEPLSNNDNIETLFSLWTQKRIQPRITDVFDFSVAPQAITTLESRSALGKIVVRMPPADH